MDTTANFYSKASYNSHGTGFPVFSGSRRQRGGGILGSLKKFFMPIAKNVGKSLLGEGVGLATDVASDALQGKNIKQSIVNRGKARAKRFGRNIAQEGLSAVSQIIGTSKRRKTTKRLKRRGAGKHKPQSRKRKRKQLRKRRKQIRKWKRQRPATSRKHTSRKRRASSKVSNSSKSKRRRITSNF